MQIHKVEKLIQIVGIVAIFIFGLFLYFYKLDKVPSGFYIDEALPGYNAYSLLKTGKDEYGKYFPTALRFYGSYNPPLYTYLTIPSIYLFGLNVFAVRVPSVVFGLLSSLVIYILLKQSGMIKNKWVLLTGLFLFIICPWNILYSRVGYEVSLGFLLLSIGVLTFWLGLKKGQWLIISFLMFSLSTYAAYAERFLAPLLILVTLIFFRKEFFGKNLNRYTLIGLLLAFITQIPHLFLMTTPAFFPKSDESIVSLVTSSFQANSIYLGKLVFILNILREFFSHYIAYFSPRNLFFLPDPDLQRSVPELPVFYFWMLIPYLAGIYWLFKNKEKMFVKYLTILFLLFPIPAALTKDPFSTHRALPFLLPTLLLIVFGLDLLLKKLNTKVWFPILTFLIVVSLIFLWRGYFVLLPKERAIYWGNGVDILAAEISKNHDTLFVIDQARTKPLYMQLAFFLKYPPDKFQELRPEILEKYYDNPEFDSHYIFANIETRNVNWEKDIYKEQILVGDELTFGDTQIKEHFLEKTFTIKSPTDEIIFVAYKTNPDKKCASKPNKSIYCK
ncbi:hypothetical protein A2771_02795 [Candidatus Woesebacteria bacterium RIFCSPHIGHO2_01_FULL_38_26b]|uniref:Glycosyltransferase RgtA/B/C/D-like domain-containing protein n=1 Tax=Candidatus Woesebacteria bacterium RIFCSPHIGHO2_01_FULL_38_26b TaxID=1802491 RepID=A0A1F7Y2N5_9BACT|nr:MAG: hypothetical protein A2771_02795 [Candidatus Woesebacteria bacterium RIFCSPHIGHO2_01_FULL_38_26b]